MEHRDPRIPRREDCVLRYVLERRAAEHPHRVFIKMPDGREFTYGALLDDARRMASGLAQLGVTQGDTVVVWMPNGVDIVRVWFAINLLGAVYVPINIAYRGNLLAHVIRNAAAKVLIARGDYIGRLNDIDTSALETVVCFGEAAPLNKPLAVKPASVLDGDPAALPPLQRPIEPWDLQSIIYTSGTTGPSKGVMSTYAHLYHMSGTQGFYMVTGEDRFMCNLPLFHVGGTVPIAGMMNRGGSVALVEAFSTNDFWPAVDATETTVVILLGVMARFVMTLPPSPDDRSHPLKKVIMIPLADDWKDFADRFGVTVWTLFNMTEISVPIVSEPNPNVLGSCGKIRRGVDIRLVDENDAEVPVGQVGELILRTDAPWALNSGYFREPEATAQAWRNGWFHTGDGFRNDEDGNYFFVDRMKDAIRRRGENISSFEVEAEIVAHPDIRECAVVPVPSTFSEDEVLAVVAPVPGRTLDPLELLRFLQPRMPHFMLPRYIRILDELPKTPTQKVQKHLLREAGLTSDTWDREAAGIKIKRQA
ncbi:AMP-binding protein [Rhodoligotrophos defluvii]|uniref:AMP-binding protein n=1 Tax=Rhodoligotrophos defluvii TaxID=2561934 RepID=UPI0010CA1E74|nr:AMP-binding protein [Rhodoligotrophos defluvii]